MVPNVETGADTINVYRPLVPMVSFPLLLDSRTVRYCHIQIDSVMYNNQIFMKDAELLSPISLNTFDFI